MTRRRAFTLVEVMTVLLLVALALGLGALQLKGPQVSTQSRALVELLASHLRQARQQAIASGTPVALAFPTAGRTQAQTQACYTLVGESQPAVTGSFSWQGEIPQATLFWGHWTLDAGSTYQAAAPLSDWTLAQPGDVILRFQPSGRLDANLPCVGGEYRLVACTGARSHSASVTGQTSFHLDAAGTPWTLRVSQAGGISVERGVTGGSGVGEENGVALAGPSAPGPGLGSNHAPTLPSVELMPPPPPGSLPPGLDGSVRPDGYVTFQVQAKDQDGEPLRCFWSSTRGSFSALTETVMEWDAAQQVWRSQYTFTPPPDAVVSAVYDVHCTVRDPRDAEVKWRGGLGGKILVTRKQRVAFASNVELSGGNNTNLYLSNVDGGERKLLFAGNCSILSPRWSPDGARLCFLCDRTGRVNYDLYTLRADGTDLKALTNVSTSGWRSITSACFTADGTKIAFLYSTGTDGGLAWTNVDGTRPLAPSTPGFDRLGAAWGESTAYNCLQPYTSGVGSNNMFLACSYEGTFHFIDQAGVDHPVSAPLPRPHSPEFCFSGDCHTLYYSIHQRDVVSCSFSWDGTTATLGALSAPIEGGGVDAQTPCVSPDGQSIFYQVETGSGASYRRRLVRRDLILHRDYNISFSNSTYEDDAWLSP